MFRGKTPTNPPESNLVTPPVLPQHPVDYPIGTCVITPEDNYYLIQADGKKRRMSYSMFLSWNFPLKVLTTEAALSKYPTSLTQLGFRDGSLLINIADGRMYLVSNHTLRHIVNPDVLNRLGVDRNDFMVVGDDELTMKRGEPIK